MTKPLSRYSQEAIDVADMRHLHLASGRLARTDLRRGQALLRKRQPLASVMPTSRIKHLAYALGEASAPVGLRDPVRIGHGMLAAARGALGKA
jgi:hypothetical protein